MKSKYAITHNPVAEFAKRDIGWVEAFICENKAAADKLHLAIREKFSKHHKGKTCTVRRAPFIHEDGVTVNIVMIATVMEKKS